MRPSSGGSGHQTIGAPEKINHLEVFLVIRYNYMLFILNYKNHQSEENL